MTQFSPRRIQGLVGILLVLSALHVTLVPFIPLADADPGATIRADPPEITGILPGEQFAVDLFIENAVSVHTWEVRVSFEKDVLKVNATIEGPFLSGGGTTGYNDYIDPAGGLVFCSAFGGSGHGGVGGNGILASVVFEVEGGGESLLDLFDTKLLNTTQGYLDHTAEDGYFRGMAPYARFTYSPSTYIPAANQTITFNASASYDPDGTIANYHWDWDDGATDDTASPLIDHVFTQPNGEGYLVNLTVTDDDPSGYQDAYDKPVIVALRDIAVTGLLVSPEALVRPDTMVEINVTVHNDGDYPEAYNLTVYRNATLIVDESRPSLLNDRNETLTFDRDTTGFDLGLYIITANVSSVYPGDNNLTNNQLNTTLTISPPPPEPPIADFDYSPPSPEVGQTVTFDATASDDPDGDIVSYAWDFGDDTTSTETNPITTHAYDSAKTYTVNLTVTDDDDQTNSFWKNITVREVGAPIASFTYTPTEPLVGELVTFDATASDDPDGDIVSYAWDFGDDTTKIYRDANLTAITNHTYTEAKTYTVKLNVTDDDGKWNIASNFTTVYTLPVANFTYSPSKPVVGDPVTFNATASYDPDGGNTTYPSGIVSYTWDFDDDDTGTGDITEHTYTDAGEYTVTLTVTDDEGLTNGTTATVTVSAQPVHNVAVTDVTPSPTVAAPGQSVSITVAVENAGGFAETFNVTAYYDTTPIGTETVALDPGAAGSPIITWDTTFVAEGVYTISANASVVDGETYTADNTYTADETVTVRRIVGPGQLLSIEFSGEREYLEDEDVKIRLVALVRYADTMGPASNATVNITIYDPDGTLWVASTMIERLAGTGIYEWESSDTIVELALEVGFYLIHVVASRGALEASEISQFHIAPVPKMSSIISIDADPISVTAGSSITLSGAITPKRARATVTILYRPEGGNWSELRSIKTSTTGHYSVGWVMTTAGAYEVKASWLGDLRAEGAESNVKTVTVRPAGSLSLDLPPYILVGAAAIVGSIVGSLMGSLMIIRLRKRQPA